MSVLSYLKRLFFPKSLEVQLAEACEAVNGIRKNGTNDDGGYRFIRILDIANALRAELLPRGIVLIPNDLECEEFTVQTADGPAIEVRVKTEFTLTDGRRSLKFCSYGYGRDQDGKAVFIAQTGALKAWYKRISLLYGEEDDPEVPQSQRPDRSHRYETGTWARHEKSRLAAYQARAWDSGVRNSGMTPEQVEAMISKGIGRTVASEEIIALPSKDFDVAMQILLRNSDLTDVLERSRKEAEQRKQPQSIAGD